MGIKFSNNGSTVLEVGITSADTTIAVVDGSVFPALATDDFCYLTLESISSGVLEIIKVTAISVNNLTCLRGQDNTVASDFVTNDLCELRVTAATLSVAPESLSYGGAIKIATSETGIDLSGTINGFNITSAISGHDNTGFGEDVLKNTTGSYNTAFGNQCLEINTTTSYNCAFGTRTLYRNKGEGNTAMGYLAMEMNDSGDNNSAYGRFALSANTSGTFNTGVGYYALRTNTTGEGNTAVGRTSLYKNKFGNDNSAYGRSALYSNFNGDSNVAVGAYSLYENTNGHRNVAVGYYALENSETDENTAVGCYALGTNTTGHSNSAVGHYALFNNLSGFCNSSLGYYAGNLTTTGNYNTLLGYAANASTDIASGEVVLGDTNVTTLRCNTATISALSDARDKTEIIDTPYGIDFINTLQPRQFKWQSRDGNANDGKTHLGFIAQELLEATAATAGGNDVIDLVMSENPDKLEAKYANLIPVLVKAIQQLSAKVAELEQTDA